MADSENPTTSYASQAPFPLSPRRRVVRWWIAIALLAAGFLWAVYVQKFSAIEGNFRFPFVMGIGLLTLIAVTIWMLFSPFRGRTKLLWLAAEVLPLVGFIFFVHTFMKMAGSYDGRGVPIFVFKNTPPPDARLAPLPAISSATTASTTEPAVDLATTTPSDWPQFLGPQRTNEAPDVHLSRDWQKTPPVELWRQQIGVGWGGFAVVNGFAVHQEQRGSEEMTTCLEGRTGKIRWRHTRDTRFSEGMGGDGPRATPTIVNGRVYVMGATGWLDCLDGASGQPIWSHNVLTDAKADNLIWGKSCSPLVYDKFVVVSGGKSPGPDAIAYDRDSGALVWHGGTEEASYCSATLCTLAGNRQVTIVNAHSVSGFDAATGDALWSFNWPGGFPKVSQTVAFPGDRLFISAGYGVGAAMLHLSPNANGTQTAVPLWKNLKLKTEFTNVVVKDKYIYGLDDGILTCLDSETGSRAWRDGSYGHGQLLLSGDVILVQAESGDVALVDASPKAFNELGRFTAFKSKTWNNPALFGKLLLVRNDLEAAAYQLP